MSAPSVVIDVALVRQLLARQFPDWTDLPLAPVASAGTDNALFRLGETMVVRLPRVDWAAGSSALEAAWLPKLGPQLPLPTPEILGVGEPAEGYPWTWTVCGWLDGRDAVASPITDLTQAAQALAGFITTLQGLDSADGPAAGKGNNYRGVALARLDKGVRVALGQLGDEIDVQAAADLWDEALASPAHAGPGVWLHGDLHPGNLLVSDGQLTAILDFGCMGVGDPACDLATAWSVLDASSRPLFRSGLNLDERAWTRGRGWALRNSVLALAFYLHSNPTLVAISRRTIAQALAG